MVDIEKLKNKITNKNKSLDEISRALNVNKSTIHRKFKNPEKFLIKEVVALVTLLELSSSEACAIFFA